MYYITLDSGDNEEYKGCRLSICFGKWSKNWKLPPIIKPKREMVRATFWDEETIKRMGRNWYWKYTSREYGVSYLDNHLNFRFGIQTGDNREQRWGCFLPWGELRVHRHSLYDLGGLEFFVNYEGSSKVIRDFPYKLFCEARENVPKVIFEFKDYDGEVIEATTHIEEREWHRGVGSFKWLSYFCKPLIRTKLEIRFNKEVGSGKHSWKGGTIGHSIELLPGELHKQAFRRYCEQRNLTLTSVKASFRKLPVPDRSEECPVSQSQKENSSPIALTTS